MWHNYNFFLLANSLVLNLNYSVKYRNTLVVSLFVEEIENLQNCPIHCVSLARKGGRDMHINIYFCISMNSGDVNTVTRAIKHYVLSIVFFRFRLSLWKICMSILSLEFFFGDIYSDTSAFDFYYQLPAIFSSSHEI